MSTKHKKNKHTCSVFLMLLCCYVFLARNHRIVEWCSAFLFVTYLLFSGLIEPPSGVTVKAVHGSDFLIILWNYQADVSLYRIVFNNPPDEAGPISAYCLPDNTTCSYCVSNMNRPDVSCSTLDSHYTGAMGKNLDFEQLVSVRVEACEDFFPEACVQKSNWKNYTIPPGGKLFQFNAR